MFTPRQQHQDQAMQQLEEFNAVKQIAEFEKKDTDTHRFRCSEALVNFSCVARRLKKMEARVRIELTRKGFADLSLTTWVPRR